MFFISIPPPPPPFLFPAPPLIADNVFGQVEKNKERLKLEQGDDKVKDSQIARLIDMEREVGRTDIYIERDKREGEVKPCGSIVVSRTDTPV